MGVVTYLQRANLPLLRINHPTIPVNATQEITPPRRQARRAVLAFGIGALLTPIGLLAPGHAFGEDGGFWHHALFHGYDVTHDGHPVVGYIVSAFVGMAVIAGVAFAAVSLIARLRSPAR
jgi:cobalt/nickel transport system permease protein